jgi:Tfp pilus assembly protein PilF
MSRRRHQIETYFQQGRHLHRLGRLAEAEQVFRHILAATPRHADSLHMLGVIALQAGNPTAALPWLDQAIAQQPGQAIHRVNRAMALLALRRPRDAAEDCRQAIRHKRNCAEAFQVLGHALCDLGQPEQAVEAYEQAARHNASLPGIHNNLGLALRQAGRLEQAADALQRDLAQAPDDAQAQGNLASLMKELGRLPEAEALYRDALRRRPDDAVLHFNLAVVLLLAGRFQEAWPEYAWRFQAGAARIAAAPQPWWQGEPLAGRRLLVRAEQGFGDTIQFVRYVPQLAGGPVILETYRPLRRLLAGLHGPAQIVALGDTLPPADLQVPLLGLPRLLPAPDPDAYLRAEPALVAAWRQRIGTTGFRVGIAWQGNPDSQAELGRSVPLRHFLPLAAIPGVRLISLQKHHGMEQLATLPEGCIETPELDEGGDAFVDTAALMQSLDLVIASDSAVAHLAGALGRPVWVALKHVPDWRWMLDRDDSPWYPGMRLFRQARRGAWDSVFAAIGAELRGLAA